MFTTLRSHTLTCGQCGYVQGVRLRSTAPLPNGIATCLTAGVWSIGWILLARRAALSNRKRCCAYCGEYLLAYSAHERTTAKARREAEMAGELSGPEPTISTPHPEPPRRANASSRSRRLPSQRL